MEDKSVKIYVSPRQYGMIRESEWNFHFGNNHDMRPYKSDNKFQMFGRETGHFGSGTYFSTYRDIKDIDDYGELSGNQNPNFIEIKEHVYRVDFDLYRNLYRVRSKKQGDVLYTMMRNLNALYNRIVSMGKFNAKLANYDNSSLYQIIRLNANGLGLRCPSYYDLVRMAQRHDGVQSFSTLFMEWNGYNGVNVSGIDFYDNTRHGSVIYDLSRVDGNMEEVSPNNLFSGFKESPYDDTIVSNGYGDEISDSLRGEYITWYNKLNDMPLVRALRVLKNYTSSGHILDYFNVKGLNSELINRYLRLLFIKRPTSSWGDDLICDEIINGKCSKYWAELIDEHGAYYWVNYLGKKSYNSVFVNLLNAYLWKMPWDLNEEEERKKKEEYLDKLMSYMERDLTDYEKEYIKEDYFDDNEQED